MPYVDLGGVRIWYEERGTGDPLLLMHGGVSDSRFFEHNVGPLCSNDPRLFDELWLAAQAAWPRGWVSGRAAARPRSTAAMPTPMSSPPATVAPSPV
jgi:hypothetical protein